MVVLMQYSKEAHTHRNDTNKRYLHSQSGVTNIQPVVVMAQASYVTATPVLAEDAIYVKTQPAVNYIDNSSISMQYPQVQPGMNPSYSPSPNNVIYPSNQPLPAQNPHFNQNPMTSPYHGSVIEASPLPPSYNNK
jgi:hypothetical protein